MSENKPEITNEEERWKFAQKVAADAIARTEQAQPEISVDNGAGQKERQANAFNSLLTGENRIVAEAGGIDPTDLTGETSPGKLTPLKEFMDKYPKIKMLSTAMLLGTTLAASACANISGYDRNIAIEQNKSESNETDIDSQHRENVRNITIKYEGEKLREELAKEDNRWMTARSSALGRHERQVSGIGERENNKVITEEASSNRNIDRQIERGATGTVRAVTDQALGRGTSASNSRRITNSVGSSASGIAVEVTRQLLRGIGIGR